MNFINNYFIFLAVLYSGNFPVRCPLRKLNWKLVQKREESTLFEAAASSFLMTHESRYLHDYSCVPVKRLDENLIVSLSCATAFKCGIF